jgi:hypothetical protein
LQTGSHNKQEKNAERAEWCSQFLIRGGVNYLVNTLLTCDFFDASRGSKRKVCLSLLLKIVNSFTVGTIVAHCSPTYKGLTTYMRFSFLYPFPL